MKVEKPLNEMTIEEIDALDVEIMSDEEMERIENFLRSIFSPEELHEMLRTPNTDKFEAEFKDRKRYALTV